MLQYESLEKSRLMDYLKVEGNKDRNHDRMAWQYAQGLDEKVNLTEVLQDFHMLVSGFYHWMILTYV